MTPRLLVLSSLFPSAAQPSAGVFIRERMFRVAKELPLVVVAPQPWFPGQGVIRLFRPHFRPTSPVREMMDGIEVHRPRFLCVPGVLKRLDGVLMAMSIVRLVRRIVREHRINIIDGHFGYPDGYAAVLLGRWLKLPVMVTLRGKEERQARTGVAAAQRRAIVGAHQLIAVSFALQALAVEEGANAARVQVIGNGVDISKFIPVPREQARFQLDLPADAEVLISVGTLVERKGFHRVIECMPGLLAAHPKLRLIIVGGAGAEGDNSAQLKRMVHALDLDERVHFAGPLLHDRLSVALSAADVFVLATSYEGWANVFLEAMACGLPVVTTDVGGNAQVVNDRTLGLIIPFGDPPRLQWAIDEALRATWDRSAIRAYAESNSWDQRMPPLIDAYHRLLSRNEKEMGQAHTQIDHAR